MAWSNAVSETESLTDQINAIKKVNALFTSAAITDGKLDSAAKIVTNVKISETPKTSNETLNKLLTQAIDLAKVKWPKKARPKPLQVRQKPKRIKEQELKPLHQVQQVKAVLQRMLRLLQIQMPMPAQTAMV